MADKPAEAAPAPKPKASGEMSPAVFMGAAGGAMVAMVAAGFALAYFILPGRVATEVEAKMKTLIAAQSHATPAEGEGAEAGQGEAAPAAEGHEAKAPEGKAEGKPEAKAEGKGEAKGEGKAEGEGAKKATSQEFILSEIMVNVANTQASRLMKVSLYFEASAGIKKKLEERRPQIIDTVSQVLRSKGLEELERKDSMGVLKNEILNRVNAVLPGGGVDDIYFLDFVIQ